MCGRGGGGESILATTLDTKSAPSLAQQITSVEKEAVGSVLPGRMNADVIDINLALCLEKRARPE